MGLVEASNQPGQRTGDRRGDRGTSPPRPRAAGIQLSRGLCRELEVRAIVYRSRVPLPLQYKGIQIANGYVIDLLIQDSLIVEVKSVANLLPIHTAQLMTYLRLKRLSAGLLINFNVPTLPRGIRRILR